MNIYNKRVNGAGGLIVLLVAILLPIASLQSFAAEGDLLWARQFGASSNLSDAGYAIAVDGSGNSYITGYFSGTALFGQANLSSIGGSFPDVFIVKLGRGGNVIWARSLGGPYYDEGWGIAVDTIGDVYVTGYFTTNAPADNIVLNPGNTTVFTGAASNGSSDIFVLKLSGGDGSLLWGKALGGSSYDLGYGIMVDDAGGVYMTGYFQGTAAFDPDNGANPSGQLSSNGFEDIFISKLNSSDGSFGGWARQIGDVNTDEGLGLTFFSAGKLYITGYFNGTVDFDFESGNTAGNISSRGGSNDSFVLEVDANGNFGWVAQMGGTGDDKGQAVTVDSAGNVICTGYFIGSATFGSDTLVSQNPATSDVYVSKLDSNGAFLWSKRMGGTSADGGYGIMAGLEDGIYTTGDFSGTADFDPSAATSNLTATGNSDIFISKLNADGTFAWASSFGGTSANDINFGYGVAGDGSGNLYLTGYFEGTTDFDPSEQVYPLTSFGGGFESDIFVLKLSGALAKADFPLGHVSAGNNCPQAAINWKAMSWKLFRVM